MPVSELRADVLPLPVHVPPVIRACVSYFLQEAFLSCSTTDIWLSMWADVLPDAYSSGCVRLESGTELSPFPAEPGSKALISPRD